MHPEFTFENVVVRAPGDVKQFSKAQLPALAVALRDYLHNIPADKPGHLASSLTVVEITVALYRVLDLPADKLMFDVGHQAYAHKVLSGRGSQMDRLRKLGGPSGFLSPAESQYDLFVSGHSSTSLSAMAGLAYADRLAGIRGRRYVVVIGDGALTAGVSFEALNFIGEHQLPIAVILNDNDYSIDATVGALHTHERYHTYANSLNIHYAGAFDGNDVEEVYNVFNREIKTDTPVLIHCRTKREVLQGEKKSKSATPLFSASIEQVLREAMQSDPRIVLVTPAMLSGAGWKDLYTEFPGRVIDAGIAEQHAVTMCAGLAKAGFIPVCHIYSSFFQRAYDQYVHDIAIDHVPVIFLVDRAGLVGEDGPTHHGLFDLALLLTVPGTDLRTPTTPLRAATTLQLLLKSVDGPTVIRYPRDGSVEAKHFEHNAGSETALVYYGVQGEVVHAVWSELKDKNTVSDVVVIEEPLAETAVIPLMKYKNIVFFHDGMITGGIGSFLTAKIVAEKTDKPNILNIGIKDAFVPHGSMEELMYSLELDVKGMVSKIYPFIKDCTSK
jgi:1-deoxy-D-xylulose-5-phosphate synthase